MCGIFAYISCNIIKEDLLQKINIEGMKCKKRGPDNTVTKMVDNNKFLMFHRLKINDMSEQGNQPIVHPDDFNITLICNGEIYNWKELADANNFNTKSTSDCEIIVHMYKKYGIEETITSYAVMRQNYYESLSTFDTFGRGWTRRVSEVTEKAKEWIS